MDDIVTFYIMEPSTPIYFLCMTKTIEIVSEMDREIERLIKPVNRENNSKVCCVRWCGK